MNSTGSTPESVAAEALRSESEDNFKRYVLYIKKNDLNSERALFLLRKSPRLTQAVIQDVSQLSRPLPSWLVSVPTLVDKHESLIRRGSETLKQLESWATLVEQKSSRRGGYKSNTSSYTAIDDE